MTNELSLCGVREGAFRSSLDLSTLDVCGALSSVGEVVWLHLPAPTACEASDDPANSFFCVVLSHGVHWKLQVPAWKLRLDSGLSTPDCFPAVV